MNPENYMGPVISADARKTILHYIELGRKEGTYSPGAELASEDGYFMQPTVFADVERDDNALSGRDLRASAGSDQGEELRSRARTGK